MEITSATTKASVTFDPFQVDFYVNNEIAVVLNSRGLMNVEYLRSKRCVGYVALLGFMWSFLDSEGPIVGLSSGGSWNYSESR